MKIYYTRDNNISLKAIILLLILIPLKCFICFSQDLITKTNGDVIEVKVDLINKEEIKYRKHNNLNGPSYLIDKAEISQIKYENGVIENFDKKTNEPTMEETKAFIKELMDNHGYEEDNFKRRCRVTFEGDFLRLNILKRNSDEPVNAGLLYDFSRVISFHEVSDRGDKAFINIFVMRQTNEKKNIWDRHKMVVRVDSVESAESILNALKHYHKLLVEKKNENMTTKF